MGMFKWQTEEKFLANMMLLSNAAFLLVSGYYFVADGKGSQALTYELMTGLMPLEAWGVVMGVAGLFLSAAAFQMGKIRYWSMIAGGSIGCIVVMLYSMAAMQGAANYLVPMRFAILACFNLLIAVLGGVETWRIRRKSSLHT